MVNFKGCRILFIPFSQRHPWFFRHFLIRLNENSDSESSNDILITCLDKSVDEKDLRSYLASFGKVKRILFQEIKSSKKKNNLHSTTSNIRIASITFKSINSIELIRKRSINLSDFVSTPDPIVARNQYVLPPPKFDIYDAFKFAEEIFCDTDKIKSHVSNYMKNFDAQNDRSKKSSHQDTTEDGFTVVRKGSVRSSDGTVIASFKMQDPKKNKIQNSPFTDTKKNNLTKSLKRKCKGGIEDDFYRFQLKEKRREELADIRRKLIADEIKIEEMKKSNMFKMDSLL